MSPTGQETGAPAAAQGLRANPVVERKLDELCASLDSALSFAGPRSPDAERRLVKDIKTKTDFLRFLLVAEGECHGGVRPVHLVEAEDRFAVLEATFDKWARRVVGAPADEEDDVCSGSSCSCTDSCQEAVAAGAGDADFEDVEGEGRRDVASCQQAAAAAGEAVEASKDVPSDATEKKRNAELETVVMQAELAPGAVAQKRDDVVTGEEKTTGAKMREDVVTRNEVPSDAVAKKREAAGAEAKKRRTVQRRWWSRSAAWCGAAGVIVVVAVGLAVELAAVAHNNVNVYVVPT